jgi:rhodanese-related sulfurtransferase
VVLLALPINAFRSTGLPFIAAQPYQSQADCPGQSEHIPMIDLAQIAKLEQEDKDIVYIDARPVADYRRKRIPEATSLPYDAATPPDPMAFDFLRGQSHATIVVYGENDSTRDPARLLVRDLFIAGFPNALALVGGIQAWEAANRPLTGN